jgi:AhpD family alkylhydroperoxidase
LSDECTEEEGKLSARSRETYNPDYSYFYTIKNKFAMSDLIKEFNDYRTKMNEVILSKNNLVMKRLWNLDTNTYEDGALDKKTKEMLGLVASMVLRCDDCIKYHLGKCHELGVDTEQMYEVFAVANIVGGTIVIPHTRRAAEYWEELGNPQ